MRLGDLTPGTKIQIKSSSSKSDACLTFDVEVLEVIDQHTILVDGLKNDEGQYYKFDNYKNELFIYPSEDEALTQKPVQFLLSSIKLIAQNRQLLSQIISPYESLEINLRGAFRLNVNAEVQLQTEPSKPVYQGYVKDVSYTGIGFRVNLNIGRVPLTLDKLHVGQTLSLGVIFPDKPTYHIYANIKRIVVAEDEQSAFIGCQFVYEHALLNQTIQRIQAQRVRTRTLDSRSRE